MLYQRFVIIENNIPYHEEKSCRPTKRVSVLGDARGVDTSASASQQAVQVEPRLSVDLVRFSDCSPSSLK
jgi:hypothetical protein